MTKDEFYKAWSKFTFKHDMEFVPETGPGMVLWLAEYSTFREDFQDDLSKQKDEILHKLFKLVSKNG